MSNKSATFTLEVRGLQLGEKEHADISKALNDTLMHHLGHLDMAASGGSTNAAADKATGNSGYIFLQHLPNGGRLEYIMSKELTQTILGLEGNNGLRQVSGVQIMSAGAL